MTPVDPLPDEGPEEEVGRPIPELQEILAKILKGDLGAANGDERRALAKKYR